MALIRLLGGAVVAISLMHPKTAAACSYTYQGIICHTGYGWTQVAPLYATYTKSNTAFINNCVTLANSSYQNFKPVKQPCVWTESYKYHRLTGWTYGTPKVHTNYMSSRICIDACVF